MDFFDELGLEINLLPKGRRPFCRPCLDWSERRYHVAVLLVRFFSDSVWSIAGLNVAATARRCKSPNTGRGSS